MEARKHVVKWQFLAKLPVHEFDIIASLLAASYIGLIRHYK